MSYLLTRLFLVDTALELGFDEDKKLQEPKHEKRMAEYFECSGQVSFRAFYRETSKITKQVWRFLKNSFIKKYSHRLYERQLRPLLTGYLLYLPDTDTQRVKLRWLKKDRCRQPSK